MISRQESQRSFPDLRESSLVVPNRCAPSFISRSVPAISPSKQNLLSLKSHTTAQPVDEDDPADCHQPAGENRHHAQDPGAIWIAETLDHGRSAVRRHLIQGRSCKPASSKSGRAALEAEALPWSRGP